MLESGNCSPAEYLISYLLSFKGEDHNCALSEEEIVDNAVVLLVAAGHDTSSILMNFMIQKHYKGLIVHGKRQALLFMCKTTRNET